MKRTISKMLGIAALAIAGIAGSLIVATPAHAAVPTCTLYTGSSAFPAPTNFYICFTPYDSNRMNTVLGAWANLPKKTAGQTVDKWRDVLQSQGAKLYYFKNRTEANDYFNRPNIPIIDPNPYAGAGDGVFSSNSARCGQTGYTSGRDLLGNNIQTIATAVYDNCTLATGQILNPQLVRTAGHEGAHAYDFALWSKHASNRNHKLSEFGFQEMLTYDLAHLNPSNTTNVHLNWPTMTTAEKNNYICLYFSSNTVGTMPSSALEQDLGSTAPSVCSGGVPVAPYLWTGTGVGTGGKSPSQIAAEKIPYFLSSGEAWAEIFNNRQGGIADGQGPNFLRLTDHILGWGTSSPTRNFNCTRLIADKYVVNGVPPTSAEFTAAGCPVPTGALY
jgi:hypothetical protein